MGITSLLLLPSTHSSLRIEGKEKLEKKMSPSKGETQREFEVSIDNGKKKKSDFCGNKVTNTKYNILTFLPLNLFEQFHRPLNMYFLVICILQFVPVLAPVSPLTSVLPLAFAFSLTAAKEGFDDYRRSKQDEKVNNRPQVRLSLKSRAVLEDFVNSMNRNNPPRRTPNDQGQGTTSSSTPSGKRGFGNKEAAAFTALSADEADAIDRITETVLSHELRVGDILVLTSGESVPCDVLLLTSSSGADGTAYCSTENLDGEADAKQKLCALPPDWYSKRRGLGSAPVSLTSSFAGEDRSASPLSPASPTPGSPSQPAPTSSEVAQCFLYAAEVLLAGGMSVSCEPPCKSLVNYTGTMSTGIGAPITTHRNEAETHSSVQFAMNDSEKGISRSSTIGIGNRTFSCSMENFILASSILRVTDYALAIAVYTGNETRVGMNKKSPPVKWARLDKSLNKYIIPMFCFQFISVVTFALLSEYWSNHVLSGAWYIGAFYDRHPRVELLIPIVVIPLRFFLLGSLMIPISFKVIVDVSKYYLSLLIQWDLRMYDQETDVTATVNNSALAEDLGQIQFLLSDKTGTLTENKMIFRYLCDSAGRTIGAKNCVTGGADDNGSAQSFSMGFSGITEDAKQHSTGSTTASGDTDQVPTAPSPFETLMALRVLALCNGVQKERAKLSAKLGGSVAAHSVNDVSSHWVSASPDEVALVHGAGERGYILTHRSRRLARCKCVSETNADRPTEEFQILKTLPFSSSRARMSVLLRANFAGLDGQYLLLTKGADERVVPLCTPDSYSAANLQQMLRHYSEKGLRTLVLAYRLVPEKEVNEWLTQFEEASVSTKQEERASKLAACYEQLEVNLRCVGVSAVQDNLQEGVERTIQDLRKANIKVWMLTGDKLETAKQIGRACGLLPPGTRTFDFDLSANDSFQSELIHSIKLAHATVCDLVGLRPEDTLPLMPKGKVLKPLLPHFEVEYNLRDAWREVTHSPYLRRSTVTKRATPQGSTPKHASGDQPQEQNEDTQEPLLSNGPFKGGVKWSKGHGSNRRHYSVVITGKTIRWLEQATDPDSPGSKPGALLVHYVVPVLLRAENVVCCRVTPDQKALIVRLVRDRGGMTCAIGDGGNDVAMIQEAHVGVGITGNEGLQAARAADFGFAKFRYLAPLLLVHGHTAFQRTAFIVNFNFYKSMIIAWCQWMYNTQAAFTGVSYFDSFSLAMWNSAISGLLVIFYVLDRQAEPLELLKNPALYTMSQTGRYLNKVTFFQWIFRALWQSALVFWATQLVLNPNMVGSTGRQFGESVQFFPTYMALLFMCIFENLLSAHTLCWFHWLGFTLSFLALMILYSAYSSFEAFGFYKNFFHVVEEVSPWALVFLASVGASILRWIASGLEFWLFPNALQFFRAAQWHRRADPERFQLHQTPERKKRTLSTGNSSGGSAVSLESSSQFTPDIVVGGGGGGTDTPQGQGSAPSANPLSTHKVNASCPVETHSCDSQSGNSAYESVVPDDGLVSLPRSFQPRC
jgi:phospholipid-translocating ATPase